MVWDVGIRGIADYSVRHGPMRASKQPRDLEGKAPRKVNTADNATRSYLGPPAMKLVWTFAEFLSSKFTRWTQVFFLQLPCPRLTRCGQIVAARVERIDVNLMRSIEYLVYLSATYCFHAM